MVDDSTSVQSTPPTNTTEEFLLFSSLISEYLANDDIRDALTQAQNPETLFCILFINQNEESSVHLGLTWAVSEEMGRLSANCSIYLCDVEDIELVQPVINYLRNIQNVAENLLQHSANGIPQTPSIIIVSPALRQLVYAEYNCKMTSLPTICEVVVEFRAENSHGRLPVEWHTDESSVIGEESESEASSGTSLDFGRSLSPNFQVFGNDLQRSVPHQRDEIAAMQRIQERNEIESEYLDALEADKKVEAEVKQKRLQHEAETQRKAAEEAHLLKIEQEKGDIRAKTLATTPGRGATRICLRTRTGEKILFSMPQEASLRGVLKMAYATDKSAQDISEVAICTTAPRTVYTLAVCDTLSLNEVTGGSTSFSFIVERNRA